MSSQEHNMAVLGQIVKHIPAKLIEKLKSKYRIQTRSFSETSHVVAMLFAQLSHALSLNDICDCLRFHKGYLAQIRDCGTACRPVGTDWLMRMQRGMRHWRKSFSGRFLTRSNASIPSSFPAAGGIRAWRGGSNGQFTLSIPQRSS